MRRSQPAPGAARALALVVWLVACTQCFAQGPAQGAEYQVKAAFLYKFAGYAEWPDDAFGSADLPFTFGVLGADALADELTRVVEGRTLNGRGVAVQRLKQGASLVGVHVLFVGQSVAMPKAPLQQWVQQRPVLVVTESEGALERGSMINFVLAEQRVRFEIAPDTAEKNGLRLSSRLLAVALKVSAGAR